MPGRTVSTRYVPLAIPTPPATLAATPLSTPINLGGVNWDSVRVIIPSGHSGLTGIRFEYAGEPIVPWGRPPQWIIADSFEGVFDVDIEIGGPVSVITYNTDYFAHSFYCHFKVSDLPLPPQSAGGLIIPVSPR